MNKRRIILIEDDVTLQNAILSFLTKLNFEVEAFEKAEDAIRSINDEVDLVLSDVSLPGQSGQDVLKFIRKRYPSVPTILMTGYGTIERAVECMKAGAYDFLIKPFSLSVLESAIESAFLDRQVILTQKAEKTIDSLGSAAPTKIGIKRVTDQFITNDKSMKEIIENIKRIAPSKATVLIQGQSGTGKELIARMIHEFSPRSKRIFVAINCAAMPDTLLESELFGHEKGAFTGAVSRQIGKFELSNNGTILLDEISEMSLTMQTKLLRVLQECEIYRVGGVKPIPLNLRVIATTNRDLYKYMKEGHFREDLYYRLNVIPIMVPALKERGEDVLFMAKEFIHEFSVLHGRQILEVDAQSEEKILNHPWPGNVRELRNAMERAVLVGDFSVLDEGIVGAGKKEKVSGGVVLPEENLSLEEIEKRAILKTLEAFMGNRTKTANCLGISLRTLRNKLKNYGLMDSGSSSTGSTTH